MDHWTGRVALVTGASTGIGASMAERLVKLGMKVVGCARNTQNIQESAEKLKNEKGSLLPVKCDLGKEEEILSMFEVIKTQYGGVDVCINNAGVLHSAPLVSGDTEKWRNILEVNVLALCICTREAIQSMKARGVDDGHIIHIGSIMGHTIRQTKDVNMYTASKYAVCALTEGLRNELRMMNSNIRISCISPGTVKTEIVPKLHGEDLAKKFYEREAYMSADDITDALIYILSAPSHVQVHDILIKPTGEVAL